MRFDVISIFPELFEITRFGVIGRAFARGQAQFKAWNPRHYARDKHRSVDDRPYGGGPGMVMMAEPLYDCIQAVRHEVPDSPLIYLSPQGQPFDQKKAMDFSQKSGLILLAGRYEGIDERLIELVVDEEWSIGDYILSGGELPALVVMETIIRLLPGVLGDHRSAEQDSYMNGLLDHPHYTRPEIFAGRRVPKVLRSGDHQRIAEWRMQQSLGRTWLRRPDLLAKQILTEKQKKLLQQFQSIHPVEKRKSDEH